MKRLIYIAILLFFAGNVSAQDVPKITLPSSPAFSILDYEPSAVMRPTNVRALGSDILNSFDKNGKLLMNLGLEVTPYWMKSHPDLKRETYLNPDLGQTILQSLSISAATVKDSASGNNKLSGGLRFKLFNGVPLQKEIDVASKKMKTNTTIVSIIKGFNSMIPTGAFSTKKSFIDAVLAALKKQNIDQSRIDALETKANELSVNYTDDSKGVGMLADALANAEVTGYADLQSEISKLLYQRKGFIVELAAATGYNAYGKSALDKTGLWANISYAVSADDYFTLTSRYMFKNTDTTLNNIDIGLGYMKKTEDFNISIEAMMRHQSAEIPDFNMNNQPITRIEKNFTWRLAAQGSFKLSEKINLNLSLGKDFDSPVISKSGFFSILGLNYSIFSKELSKLN